MVVGGIVFKARLVWTLNRPLLGLNWERLEPESGENRLHRLESRIAGVRRHPVTAFNNSGNLRKRAATEISTVHR